MTVISFRPYIFLLCLFIFLSEIQAQNNQIQPRFLLSIMNANTMLPGKGDLYLSSTKVHFGFNFGVEYDIKNSLKRQWIYSFNTGYFYHKDVQHAIRLFGDIGYRRYLFSTNFSLESRFGLGYLHSIPDLQVFKLNQEGNYINGKGFGRAQAMAALSIAPSYTFRRTGLNPIRIFIDYQFMIQTPFVNNYVPILPYNLFHIGVSTPIHSCFKKAHHENK
ncbi:MAG: hypothetical protein ABI851_06135 [Saprospiraceae bacterium]